MPALTHSTKLGAKYVEDTTRKLQARIAARFPERHLSEVAAELAHLVPRVSRDFSKSQRRYRRMRISSRVGSAVVVLAVIVSSIYALHDVVTSGIEHSSDWVPLIESLVNDLVFASIAVFFLWALPERIQRRKVLDLLHQLRSLAHVVDMHQLDKDPEQVSPDYRPTAASPPHNLDADQLHHYFDYCSELLSLIAKTAALTAEHTSDPVVLGTVSDLETLTAEMSQKIWQKVALLPRYASPSRR